VSAFAFAHFVIPALVALNVWSLWRWRFALNGWRDAVRRWGEGIESHQVHMERLKDAHERERQAATVLIQTLERACAEAIARADKKEDDSGLH
jgi:hypothetical protein